MRKPKRNSTHKRQKKGHLVGHSCHFNTMRIDQGLIAGQTVATPINLGSSNNFLTLNLAKKLKQPINTSLSFFVVVANGERMCCGGRCLNVKLNLSTYSTSTNFYLLELEDLNVVLCVE